MYENSKKKKLLAAGVLAAIIIAAVSLSILPTNAGTTSSDLSATPTEDNQASATPTDSSSTSSSATASSTSSYKNGTYSGSASYRTPESIESIDVTVTLTNGVVTSSTVSQDPQNRKSALYQSDFADSYKSYVDGKAIDSIALDRVSGSSLTSNGFNRALAAIKSQAKS